jgi:hypothetical protein
VLQGAGYSNFGIGTLEHDAEKACPALDAGWIPVLGKTGMTIQRKVIPR